MSAVSPDAAPLMALKRIATMVDQQALTLTYNDVFMAMGIAFFIAVPMAFLLAKTSIAGAAGGGH
jgi:hypothetical protein